MEFSCRLISDGCDRGSSFFFQPHRPIATEQVALELELFDGRRKRGLDWHDLDSADTVLNIRARIENRSRARNFRDHIFAVAKINLALHRKIDLFGCGIQELERSLVAAKSQSPARARQIERRILQNTI